MYLSPVTRVPDKNAHPFDNIPHAACRQRKGNDMKIMLAVPMLNDVPVDFMLSLMQLKMPPHTQLGIERNTLVYSARNNLYLKAENGGYDWIFWIDSDMVFPSDTLTKLIETAEQGYDFVSGLAFSRNFPSVPTICKSLHWNRTEDGKIEHGCEQYKDYPRDSVFEIAAAGCACLLMKTELCDKAIRGFGAPPFDPLPCLGEDYSFCWKLSQLGVKMVCDSRVKVGHIGTFVYNEESYLKQGDIK